MNALSYCGELVRAHDPDRFLISLFAPEKRREALWALFAFNHEIAKTREVVSDPTLGRIRLQWWMDSIVALYAGHAPPEHEILKPLALAIKEYDLPRAEFETLIAARNIDLDAQTFSDAQGLLSYAEATSAPLMELALRIEGREIAAEPVQAVATNYAIAGLLRAAPYRKIQGWDMLPAAPREIAAHFLPRVPARSRVLRAAQALAKLYMKRTKELDYDINDPRMAEPVPFKELRVAARALIG